MIKWTSIEAECNCPDRLQTFKAFRSKRNVDRFVEAKQAVEEAIEEHIEENEHCSEEHVTKTAHYERKL